MGSVAQLTQAEVADGFAAFVWGAPPGTAEVHDATSMRHTETGYTVVKFTLDEHELKRIEETGEVFLVLCSPPGMAIPPFWVGARIEDAQALAGRAIR